MLTSHMIVIRQAAVIVRLSASFICPWEAIRSPIIVLSPGCAVPYYILIVQLFLQSQFENRKEDSRYWAASWTPERTLWRKRKAIAWLSQSVTHLQEGVIGMKVILCPALPNYRNCYPMVSMLLPFVPLVRINVFYGNNSCLLWESFETKNIVWEQFRVFEVWNK